MKRTRELSFDEIELIRNYGDFTVFYPLIIFMLITSLSVEEIAGIREEDFNPAERTVRISREYFYNIEEGIIEDDEVDGIKNMVIDIPIPFTLELSEDASEILEDVLLLKKHLINKRLKYLNMCVEDDYQDLLFMTTTCKPVCRDMLDKVLISIADAIREDYPSFKDFTCESLEQFI